MFRIHLSKILFATITLSMVALLGMTLTPVKAYAGANPAMFTTIDSNVLFNSPTNYYAPLAGYLSLTLKPSTSIYTGAFIDGLNNKTYPASADITQAATPTLTINGKNGKFVFTMDQSFGSSSYIGSVVTWPTKMGLPPNGQLLAKSHSANILTLSVQLSEKFGPIVGQNGGLTTGTLAFTYDSWQDIIAGTLTLINTKDQPVKTTLNGIGHYFSELTYFNAKAYGKNLAFAGRFTSASTISGQAFSGSGASQIIWSWNGTII